jgi:hypothetical protein
VIVKRLSDALADGDPIRCLIRNTAVGHSGRTPGITHPSRSAQEELLTMVHREVGLDPNDTPFVEVSSSGKPLAIPGWAKLTRFAGSWNGNQGWVSFDMAGIEKSQARYTSKRKSKTRQMLTGTATRSMAAPFPQWPQAAGLPRTLCTLAPSSPILGQ